jgi:hypothetical protein
MKNKMYLTAAEAKEMNLSSMEEQIAKHNALMKAIREEATKAAPEVARD